jgi:hypothetical protein
MLLFVLGAIIMFMGTAVSAVLTTRERRGEKLPDAQRKIVIACLLVALLLGAALLVAGRLTA